LILRQIWLAGSAISATYTDIRLKLSVRTHRRVKSPTISAKLGEW